jgi:hypothetical protein
MKMKRILITSVIAILSCIIIYLVYQNTPNPELEFYPPKDGFVNDELTAIRIAEAISLPIFGEHLKYYKPFHARMKNDSIWEVYGIPREKIFFTQYGGNPVIKIQKKDGKILTVYISK